MVDREALEQFERDLNPYAVDPRLTEGTDAAAPRSDEVLEYRRRVTWGMIDWKRLLQYAGMFAGFYCGGVIFVGLAILTVQSLTGGPSTRFPGLFMFAFFAFGAAMSILFFAICLILWPAMMLLCNYRLRITPDRLKVRVGIFPSIRFDVRKITAIEISQPFSFRFALSNILPVKHAITIRQNAWKGGNVPCRDAADQEQMLREIEQFLKRY